MKQLLGLTASQTKLFADVRRLNGCDAKPVSADSNALLVIFKVGVAVGTTRRDDCREAGTNDMVWMAAGCVLCDLRRFGLWGTVVLYLLGRLQESQLPYFAQSTLCGSKAIVYGGFQLARVQQPLAVVVSCNG